jgi:hypothetical protein
MRRLPLVLAVIAATWVAAPGAPAGAPKAQRLVRLDVRGSGAIVATVSQGATETRVVLAQVRSPRRIASGRGCPVQPTDYALSRVADRLGLADGVQVVPDAQGSSSAAYLAPAGQAFRASSSLNGRAVRAGLARLDRTRGSYRSVLARLQHVARGHHAGLWSRCRQR